MARNEEKQLGRLNRYYLKKQNDEIKKKNPRRPRLDTLHSIEEIKHWIPSIKKDIEFYLKQSQVPCYPEKTVADMNRKIDRLQSEYKAFIHKLKRLDPNIRDIPWTDRAYQNSAEKRLDPNIRDIPWTNWAQNSQSNSTDQSSENKDTDVPNENSTDFVPLYTPILERDFSLEYVKDKSETLIQPHTKHQLEDEPLQFVKRAKHDSCMSPTSKELQGAILNIPYSDSSDDDTI